MEENKIYICLENGNVFEGKSFGAKGEVIGELVFTTGMGGYIETLTSPRPKLIFSSTVSAQMKSFCIATPNME